ncbi:MAG: DUF86 domain-containing protein [Hyphomicrobiales bacterium]|nr:DUF86 domain-containing protein [Hyphomicrobiales bacterium]
MARDPRVCITHMIEALDHIAEDLAGHDFESFRGDRRARQLLERNLEILSEASRGLPPALKEREPDTPWKAIAGIGNVLRHDYHRTYPRVLWDTVEKDLDPLRATPARLARYLDEASRP